MTGWTATDVAARLADLVGTRRRWTSPAAVATAAGLAQRGAREHDTVFARVAAEFAAFIGEARLVIHNAAFDMKFLNAELGWAGQASVPWARAVDTLELARRRFPGAQNTLDALCRRFGVDNSAREKHGALLDSELLAEVYLELMGGRQPDLSLIMAVAGPASGAAWVVPPRPRPLAPRLTLAEAEAHARFIAGLGEGALWVRA